MRFFFLVSLRDVEPQPVGIQIQFVLSARFLQDRRNVPRVLDPPQIHVTSTLLDGVANEFCGASFTLGAYHCSLLFLASFVHDECSPLGFLLSDLLGLDCCGEFRRER